jgi:hypothetical protein
MPSARCLKCAHLIVGLPSEFRDTVQCANCATVLRIVTRNDRVADVRLPKFDLDIPSGLPSDIEQILAEAVICFESGSNVATVVLAGLFVEGLLTKTGAKGSRLVEMIKSAHDAKMISSTGFHVASASRLLRNVGAHYSADLARLLESDARLVLEMARKLASDVLASGAIPAP